MKSKRIIVGVSGASGIPVLIDCLKIIREAGYTSVMIMSEASLLTVESETDLSISEIKAMADEVLDPDDYGAGPASGTYETLGMVVVPCSMKTLAGIHAGYGENLLLRAADVTIKEKRPLVLGVRETPLSPIHLRNMQDLSMISNVHITPLVLTYYIRPETVEDMTYHMAAKLLSPFGIETAGYRRWKS